MTPRELEDRLGDPLRAIASRYDRAICEGDAEAYQACMLAVEALRASFHRERISVPSLDAAMHAVLRQDDGVLPRWGETSRFTVLWQGVPVLIEYRSRLAYFATHFAVHALRSGRFVSETGYLSIFDPVLPATTVEDRARWLIQNLKPVLIRPENLPSVEHTRAGYQGPLPAQAGAIVEAHGQLGFVFWGIRKVGVLGPFQLIKAVDLSGLFLLRMSLLEATGSASECPRRS